MSLNKCVAVIIPSSAWDITGYGAPDSYLCVMPHKRGGKVGLPGGKMEPGETPEQAAAREVFEETGLRYDPSQFTHLGCLPDDKVECHLFTVPPPAEDCMVRASAEGDVSWLGRAELLNATNGAYPAWNRWAFGRYDNWCTAMGQPSSERDRTVKRVTRAFKWMDSYMETAREIAMDEQVSIVSVVHEVAKTVQRGLRNAGLLTASETVTPVIATQGDNLMVGYVLTGLPPTAASMRKRLTGDLRRPASKVAPVTRAPF